MKIEIEIDETLLQQAMEQAISSIYHGQKIGYDNEVRRIIQNQAMDWARTYDYRPEIATIAPAIARQVLVEELEAVFKRLAKQTIKEMKATGELGGLLAEVSDV